ncbi:hypothetical protein WH47_03367 [Habropoda laboriosa]|uniref:Uncharacterized protein n=1 Tax=Habropoda laboriosa TaxID=597456 RepID=A0A0L7RBG6_9HYME|nr:hypothetical protein WH47_03367 [Habropoda laboriosa]
MPVPRILSYCAYMYMCVAARNIVCDLMNAGPNIHSTTHETIKIDECDIFYGSWESPKQSFLDATRFRILTVSKRSTNFRRSFIAPPCILNRLHTTSLNLTHYGRSNANPFYPLGISSGYRNAFKTKTRSLVNC